MTTFADVAPTQGDNGNSFEWLWDICADPANPVWINVPDITGLNPSAPPKQKDDTTYANKGQTSQAKTGEDWTMQVQVKGVRDNAGEFQEELLILIAAADAIGGSNVIGYRYYHATSPSLAYEGTAGVEWTRANTDNDSIEFFQFTLTGKGDRQKIANPGVTVPKPTIVAATPPNAAAGTVVVVTGSAVEGATGVKFGATAATTFQPAGRNRIAAVVPAGTAGSAPITVTTPAGTSDPFAYTRGA
ncbi:phage tail tube protein [Leifsonia sp. WHRI 6310E]|uniref:phage tail tube protein n=1 Tax=Leifsonia sp. WHRI 6310E TaxID=3162562 RepID=UPI0032F09673